MQGIIKAYPSESLGLSPGRVLVGESVREGASEREERKERKEGR